MRINDFLLSFRFITTEFLKKKIDFHYLMNLLKRIFLITFLFTETININAMHIFLNFIISDLYVFNHNRKIHCPTSQTLDSDLRTSLYRCGIKCQKVLFTFIS